MSFDDLARGVGVAKPYRDKFGKSPDGGFYWQGSQDAWERLIETAISAGRPITAELIHALQGTSEPPPGAQAMCSR